MVRGTGFMSGWAVLECTLGDLLPSLLPLIIRGGPTMCWALCAVPGLQSLAWRLARCEFKQQPCSVTWSLNPNLGGAQKQRAPQTRPWQGPPAAKEECPETTWPPRGLQHSFSPSDSHYWDNRTHLLWLLGAEMGHCP